MFQTDYRCSRHIVVTEGMSVTTQAYIYKTRGEIASGGNLFPIQLKPQADKTPKEATIPQSITGWRPKRSIRIPPINGPIDQPREKKSPYPPIYSP